MHHFYVMEKKHLLFHLRPPVFIVPMALTEREEASIRASEPLCSSEVEGMVPLSCPSMDCARSFTIW